MPCRKAKLVDSELITFVILQVGEHSIVTSVSVNMSPSLRCMCRLMALLHVMLAALCHRRRRVWRLDEFTVQDCSGCQGCSSDT